MSVIEQWGRRTFVAQYRLNTRINVVRSNGLMDRISTELLDRLIAANGIDQFERSDGWVQVGIDPIRGMGEISYFDYDRRKNITRLP